MKQNLKEQSQSSSDSSSSPSVEFRLYRVPFFLEPDYLQQPDNFFETHDQRMIRKFGSKEAFERVKLQHQLVPRGRAAGLTEEIGFTEENLSKRIQSSTLNAHRLVQYVMKEYSLDVAERLYDILNRKHFCEGGVLNDRSLLLSSTEEVGLDRVKCEVFLNSTNGIDEILEMVEAVHSLGIHSIPVLVINGGQSIIQGAAPVDEIIQKIQMVWTPFLLCLMVLRS